MGDSDIEEKQQTRFYIYLTTNLITGKKYIGQRSCHCEIGKDTYLGSGEILKKAIKKYGKKHFEKQILEICFSKDELNLKEMQWIEFFDAVNSPDFYNITSGGTGGNTYRFLSKVRLENIKQIKKEQNKGENNPMFGHVWTEESRMKMSKSAKERYKINKLNWGKTGKTGSQNSLSMVIYSPELKREFVGIREAARELNIPSPNLIRALKSEGRFSAGKLNGEKLHWFYKKRSVENESY